MSSKSDANLTPLKRATWRYYYKNQRHFSWRTNRHPYRILVSEIMLQQTQTKRVEEKYTEFLQCFPSVRILANAPFSKVLSIWSGLGYNRRARNLHLAAKKIVSEFRGKVPGTYEELRSLPGVGDYTARAVLAFAFDVPTPFLETNIRSVFIHHLYPGKRAVADRELLPWIEKALDRRRPREWYYALMDYGAFLKSREKGLTARSAAYKKQSAFKGSLREVRGTLLKLLVKGPQSRRELIQALERPKPMIVRALNDLSCEGLVEERRGIILISEKS